MHASLSEDDAIAIQNILIEQLEIPRSQITPEARIQADLTADSLDIVEITMKLEERLALTIPDEEADQVKTVADLYDVVARLRGRSASAGTTLNPEVPHGTGRS